MMIIFAGKLVGFFKCDQASAMDPNPRTTDLGIWSSVYLFTIIAVLVIESISHHAIARDRIALVIGNQSYSPGVGALVNPANDVRIVGDSLRSVGFDVLPPLVDATRDDILLRVYDFAARLRDAGPEAVGFVYYSGHGVASGNENYLLPVDLDAPSSRLISVKGIKQSEIIEILQNTAANAVHYLVFDACRNNLLGSRGSKGFVPVIQRSGVLVAFSTSPGSTASDSGADGGPYAVALASEIVRSGQHDLDMFHNVRIAVIGKTGGDQVPWTLDGIQRRQRIRFAPDSPPSEQSSESRETAEKARRQKDAESRFWEIASVNSCVLWGIYIDQFSDVPAWNSRARAARAGLQCDAPAQNQPLPSLPRPPPSANPEAITVAISGPMTGTYATFGEQMKSGAESAIADINAAGGVLGRQLKLEIGDDACDPKQAVSVAKKLARQGIAFMAGHFCSGSSIPASHVYAEQRIVQISPASTNPRFTDERPGPNIYRVSGRDDRQGSIAGAYLARTFKDKRVAILHDKSAYGKSLADEAKKAMNAAGKQEVFYEAITAGEKDYRTLVSALKLANVELVYFGGYHTEAGLIVRQMRSQGMKTVLMGGDALATAEYWQITGKDGEGTLMTFTPDQRKNPAAADQVKAFLAKGVEPEGYLLYAYAAFQTWKQAVEKAGSVEAEKVIEALNGTTFDTAIGTFTFDAKGDPSLTPFAIFLWKDGNYDQM